MRCQLLARGVFMRMVSTLSYSAAPHAHVQGCRPALGIGWRQRHGEDPLKRRGVLQLHAGVGNLSMLVLA
jgi:hypothetical protein